MTASDTICEPPPTYDSISSVDIDKLPPYSNSIHLVTLCHRKLEYTAPNVPARKGTRGWHFCWIVLYGTALSIYQPTRSEVNAHLKREANIRALRFQEHNRAARARKNNNSSEQTTSDCPLNVLYPNPNQNQSISTTRTTTSHQSPSPSPSPPPSLVHKCPFNATRDESLHGPLTPSDPPSSPLDIGGKPHSDNQTRPDLRTHTLVKQYTMNGATCVRAYDYLRRYFVLRIRADGQQFMVQLNSYPDTLEWLAAFSVAACLCLDLDERPMVEAPAYPRRQTHPSDSSTHRQPEISNPHNPESLASSEALQLLLTARSHTIRINS